MNETATPSILWIGSAKSFEFAEVRRALDRLTRVTACRTFREALEHDPADDCVLVVVAEALPGEHLATEYAALRLVRPGVPIVRVYGSLCEGELRTNPPPQTVRLSWLSAAAALTADWRRFERGACPNWGRPAAASDEECLLADIPAETEATLPLRHVGLQVRDPATAAWLRDFLERRGVTVVRIEGETAIEPPDVDVTIWDRPLNAMLREAELSRLRYDFPRTPFVVLANFPRVDEVQKLREAGAVAVLGKPLAPNELELALRFAVESIDG